MKNLVKYMLLICCLGFVIFANAQKRNENTFLKVSKKIKTQKLNEVLLLNTKQPKKKPNCLNYKCDNKREISFCNDNSDENYVEFQELGYIKKTEIVVINKFNFNEEFYILLNKKACSTLTLYGFPLKIENSEWFIVYNNPPTDQRKKIQILKLENGKMSLYSEIVFPEKIKLQKFIRLESNQVYILDQKNQLWKTTIKK